MQLVAGGGGNEYAISASCRAIQRKPPGAVLVARFSCFAAAHRQQMLEEAESTPEAAQYVGLSRQSLTPAPTTEWVGHELLAVSPIAVSGRLALVLPNDVGTQQQLRDRAVLDWRVTCSPAVAGNYATLLPTADADIVTALAASGGCAVESVFVGEGLIMPKPSGVYVGGRPVRSSACCEPSQRTSVLPTERARFAQRRTESGFTYPLRARRFD
jgi:hypothetical protein